MLPGVPWLFGFEDAYQVPPVFSKQRNIRMSLVSKEMNCTPSDRQHNNDQVNLSNELISSLPLALPSQHLALYA